MIRFLQQDNKAIKILFWFIIVASCVAMVIFLVPGIFAGEGSSSDTYAVVHSSGGLGRVFGSTSNITTPEVQQIAQRMLQQQHLPDQLLPYLLPRAGQALIQREVLVQEANRLGYEVSDADLTHYLQSGPFGQALFPNGQFVGQDRYADFVQNYFQTSIHDFEQQVKKEIEIDRLEAAVTGGISVSDQQVRDTYREQGTKIKFDYAVLNSDDLSKQINPTDAELQKFFTENAARYKNAVPETRTLTYIAFNRDQVSGGEPKVTDQEIADYYQAHQKDYQVPEEVKVRHILIKVPENADAKTDQAAKQKAEDLLKQIKAGADFATLAKKYSDDPGSKAQGGELGFIQRGVTVPAFEKAAFALQPGEISGLVKTQFGYHIIKAEAKQAAHTKSLDEVKGEILATLTREKEDQQMAAFAQQLATEAAKEGLSAAAQAHHLQVATAANLQQSAAVPGLADSSKMLSLAFSAKQGAPPQVASTGDGFAVFQVTAIQPAHAPVFTAYKSHLLDDFRQQQLPVLLARKTEELANKAKADGNLAKAAKEVGATMKTSDLVDRTAQVPDIGQLSSAAPDIFHLNVGQISKAINTGHTGVVIKMDDKQQPDAAEIAKNFDATREQLLETRRNNMFAVFVTNLTANYEKRGLIRLSKSPTSALGGDTQGG